MKAFRFRLQALLDVHEKEKDALLAQLTELREQLSAIATSDTQLQTVKNTGMKQSITSASQAQIFYRYVDSIDVVTHQNQLKREELKEVETELLQDVSAIQKKIKVIEKLKAKKLQEHQSELQKTEQKFLDELGTRRFLFK